jgi:hypothetical protein
MSSISNQSTKYRPYFTLPQLQEISRVLKTNGSQNLTLIRYVDTFLAKIEFDAVSRVRIEDRLGFGVSQAPIDLAAMRLEAYEKWKTNPADTSVREMGRVLMYRYENDLMSPEEEREYERANGMC